MWWEYDELPSGEPYDWGDASRGGSPYDNVDFHVDLGCGRVKKARLGIDRFYSPGVDLTIDLEELVYTQPRDGASQAEHDISQRTADLYVEQNGGIPGVLPFPDNSIKSIITHHCFEHIGNGFMRLMDECYRVLEPRGLLRIIVPAFPSAAAVGDPTHVRYFCENTWVSWAGRPDSPFFSDGFAEPYTICRFELCDVDMTPYPFIPGTDLVDTAKLWGKEGAREFRVAYRKWEDA